MAPTYAVEGAEGNEAAQRPDIYTFSVKLWFECSTCHCGLQKHLLVIAGRHVVKLTWMRSCCSDPDFESLNTSFI